MSPAAPRVAVIQMVSTESVETNLRSAARLLVRKSLASGWSRQTVTSNGGSPL